MDYDVFMSHASEDKESFVAPLAELLANMGVKVWYDAFTLKVGDSLLKSIKVHRQRSFVILLRDSRVKQGVLCKALARLRA